MRCIVSEKLRRGVRRLLIPGTGVSHTASLVAYARLLATTGSTVFPLHKLGLVDPEESIERLTKNLEDNGPAILIGHSQGGLVATVVATRHPSLVERVISLGAPLQGSLLASSKSPIPSVRAMAPGSFLTRSLVGSPKVHCIVGTHDLCVLPYESGLLPGAHHYRFPTGHLGLIRDDRVARLVIQLAFTAYPLSYSGLRNDIANRDIGRRSA